MNLPNYITSSLPGCTKPFQISPSIPKDLATALLCLDHAWSLRLVDCTLRASTASSSSCLTFLLSLGLLLSFLNSLFGVGMVVRALERFVLPAAVSTASVKITRDTLAELHCISIVQKGGILILTSKGPRPIFWKPINFSQLLQSPSFATPLL